MSFVLRRALIAVCVSVTALVPGLAQELPSLVQVVTVRVKPDRVSEFLAIQGRFAEAARER